ncbi:MAG TPA: divalent metal cation transporter [Deltaproteobacteria bacterium]|nr:divalent metal cation transporter [Deltaproteobacteria bacterium]
MMNNAVLTRPNKLQVWRSYAARMGPAWIIAADASGPATLASLCIAGATYSYNMLWVVLLSVLFGATAQYMAARVGILEGRGIIATVKDRFGTVFGWIVTLDALLVTWLAALVLMNALAGVTALVTGIASPLWGCAYAVILALFLIKGGYRWFERLCKLLVVFILAAFVTTLGMADLSWSGIASGLVPNLPGGMDSALMMAAIMGGAVHITIIGMHTYTTNAKMWGRNELKLAFFDNTASMGLAFGLYSVIIFLVAASVLHPNHITVKTATDAAMSLEPLLGKNAMRIFMLGLWGAAFSTLSPTVLAGVYFFGDAMGWPLHRKDRRMNLAIVAGCSLAAFGPLLKGGFFLLLPLMLALGLCGTPLIIAIIIYLLNREDVAGEHKNSLLLNVLGIFTFLVTTFLALRFITSRIGIL